MNTQSVNSVEQSSGANDSRFVNRVPYLRFVAGMLVSLVVMAGLFVMTTATASANASVETNKRYYDPRTTGVEFDVVAALAGPTTVAPNETLTLDATLTCESVSYSGAVDLQFQIYTSANGAGYNYTNETATVICPGAGLTNNLPQLEIVAPATPGNYEVSFLGLTDVDARQSAAPWRSDLTLAGSFTYEVAAPAATNTEPSDPVLTGNVTAAAGAPVTLTATANDPDGNPVRYQFDWTYGGSSEVTTDYVPSGDSVTRSRTWSTPGTYVIRVRAQDDSGQTNNASNWVEESIVITSATDTAAPSVPVVHGAATLGLGQSGVFSFTSSDVSGQVEYEVEFDEAPDAFSGAQTSGATWDVNRTWATVGVKNYRVRAIDPAGNTSPWVSDSVTISTAATPVPPDVTLEVGINGGAFSEEDQSIIPIDSIRLRWSSTGADSCLTSGSNNSGFNNRTNLTRTVYVNSPPAGDTYFYTVTCTNADGSTARTISVTSENNAMPVAVLEANVNGGGWSSNDQTINNGDNVQLRWTCVRATNSSASGAGFSTGGALSGTDTSITEPAGGSSAAYSVNCQSGGNSGTDALTITTLDSGPLTVSSASVIAGNAVTFNWQCPTTVGGAPVTEIDLASGINVNETTTGGAADSYVHTFNTPGTYVVAATCYPDIRSLGDAYLGSVLVTVENAAYTPPQIASISGPESVTLGDTATYNFSSSGTEEVYYVITWHTPSVAQTRVPSSGTVAPGTMMSVDYEWTGTRSRGVKIAAIDAVGGVGRAEFHTYIAEPTTNGAPFITHFTNVDVVPLGEPVEIEYRAVDTDSATLDFDFIWHENNPSLASTRVEDQPQGALLTQNHTYTSGTGKTLYIMRATDPDGNRSEWARGSVEHADSLPVIDLQVAINGGAPTAADQTLSLGDTVTGVTWSATNADWCQANPDGLYGFSTGSGRPVSGTDTVDTPPPGNTYTYRIECGSDAGSTFETISVSGPMPDAPTVDLEVSVNGSPYTGADQTISDGDTIAFAFTSTNTGSEVSGSCVATNGPGFVVSGTSGTGIGATTPDPDTAEIYEVTCSNVSGPSVDSIVITTGAEPDLIATVGSVTPSAGIDPITGIYDYIDISILTQNTVGGSQASNVDVLVELDTNEDGNYDDESATYTIASLTSTVPDTRVIRIASVPFGDIGIRVTVDPSNTIAESNEGNNVTISNQPLLPPNPELSITVIPSDFVREGTSVEVEYNMTASYPMNCSLSGPALESPNPFTFNPSADGQSGTRNAGPLSAKAEYTLTCVEPSTGAEWTAVRTVENIGSVGEI